MRAMPDYVAITNENATFTIWSFSLKLFNNFPLCSSVILVAISTRLYSTVNFSHGATKQQSCPSYHHNFLVQLAKDDACSPPFFLVERIWQIFKLNFSNFFTHFSKLNPVCHSIRFLRKVMIYLLHHSWSTISSTTPKALVVSLTPEVTDDACCNVSWNVLFWEHKSKKSSQKVTYGDLVF